jgi:hypothetical protein
MTWTVSALPPPVTSHNMGRLGPRGRLSLFPEWPTSPPPPAEIVPCMPCKECSALVHALSHTAPTAPSPQLPPSSFPARLPSAVALPDHHPAAAACCCAQRLAAGLPSPLPPPSLAPGAAGAAARTTPQPAHVPVVMCSMPGEPLLERRPQAATGQDWQCCEPSPYRHQHMHARLTHITWHHSLTTSELVGPCMPCASMHP